MDFKNIDVSKLLFNPLDENLVKLMSKYKEFTFDIKGFDKKSILKYIILMYDINTPLRKEVPQFHTRKYHAAKLAGLIYEKEMSKEVEDLIFTGTNASFNIMVVKYLLLFDNPAYVMLMSYYNLLYKFGVMLMGSLEVAEYQKIEKTLSEFHTKINSLSNEVFGGNEIIEIRKLLYSEIEDNLQALTPEGVVERVKNGEEPVDYNPYGNYKPDLPKFIPNAE